MYIDGHLDLATNVIIHHRDLTQDVMAMRREEERDAQEALVTLPELRRGGVGIVFGTLFALSLDAVRSPDASPLAQWQVDVCYDSPDEAHALGVDQLNVYEQWEEDGHVRILRSRRDLDAHTEAWIAGDRTLGLVMLMEGADPIRTPEELSWWWARGLRIVGPAWKRTRYSGGTDAPGPLTEMGEELILAMKEQGVALDVSHMAEESFWDAMALDPELVVASHSNARAITPGNRHLSDDMIEAVGAKEGIIGIVLGNAFVKPEQATEAVTLDDVRRHAEHIADLVGWNRVAIGSDFDGGFGLQETPRGITRGADFAKIGRVAPPAARAGLLGANWLRFLRRALPA
jgi:membrane dipeptidase